MRFLSLAALIFLPLIASGMIICPLFPNHEVKIRRFAKIFASAHFVYTLMFLLFFNPSNFGMSYEREIKVFGSGWLEPLGISASFGVDGLSLILIVLTSFLVLLALIASKNTIKSKQKLYYSMVFILQTAILGIFCARDMFLFFMFWELELIPMYFLIGQWGDVNAKKSATKFVLFTFLGSIFMLFAMLCLYFCNLNASSQLTANMSLLTMSDSKIWFQYLIFICFFIGFAVKIPIFPLHTWLPDAHVDAPAPVSMILAGILLKLGAYGLIRFNIQIFPEIFRMFAPILLVLGVINIIYASLTAFAQADVKKVIAYSSIAHMGIVIIGLGAMNQFGFNGAVFQMIAHGLISAGLFMVIGTVYLRTKTREIKLLGGLGQVMPSCMYFALVICLAGLGMPLLIGFPGELMSILGVINADFSFNLTLLVTIFATSGVILSACYILYILHKTFYSNILEKWKNVKDLVGYEYLVLFSLCIVIIVFGIYPMGLINIFQNSSSVILDLLKV